MSEISVLMPIYNAERYLRICLESIINQRFNDFEVIMVDDGSSDNSYKIAEEISKKDSRFKIIRKENGGSGAARNTLLDYFFANSSSKYIVWVDSDDILDSCYLEVLYKAIELKKCDIVQCSFEYFDKNNIIRKSNNIIQFNSNKKGMDMLELLFEGKQGISLAVLWNKIFSRNLFLDVRVHNNEKFTGRIGDDEDILWRIYNKTNEVWLVDNILYFYRITEGSQQHSKITCRILETFEIWIDRWIYCNENNLVHLKSIVENKIIFVIALLSSKKQDEYDNYLEFKVELKNKFNEISKIIPFELISVDKKILAKLSKFYWNVFCLYGISYKILKRIKDYLKN